MHSPVAFCSPGPLSTPARIPVRAPRTCHVRASAAGPPRRVVGTLAGVREAMQAALAARRSRLAVRLPDGMRLGLEKGGGATGVADFVRADRELARCIASLFDGTGLKTCVVLPAAGEMRAAQKAFGPVSECRFDCWEDGSVAAGGDSGGGGRAQRRRQKGKVAAKGPPPSAAGGGFGAAAADAGSAPVQPGAVMSAGDFDVYVVVGPRQPSMARVRQLCQKFGDEVLIILANGRVEKMKGLPSETEKYMVEEFEDVYFWATDPCSTYAGGVLFRKFPEDWVLGRATPVGTMQRLLEAPEKPSDEEMTNILKAEAEKPTSGILNKVANFIEGRN